MALAAGQVEPFHQALHAWGRRLGVIVGGRGRDTPLRLLTPESDETSARDYARDALDHAARAVGIDPAAAEVVAVTCRRRDVTGKPRRLDSSPAGSWRTVELPDGRRLRALAPADPLGEWVVHLEAEPASVWCGRWLLAVLCSVLGLRYANEVDGVYEAVAELAGRETPIGIRYACPCCDFLTLDRPPTGTHQICPVCWWEDDKVQFEDPEYRGGANRESLLEARAYFRKTGASALRRMGRVRPPLPEEYP